MEVRDDNIQTKEIGGAKYTAFKLPPKKAWNLQLRLIKILGPSLQDLASLTAIKDKEQQEREALKALSKFAGSIDPDELTSLLVEVTSYARKNGEQISPVTFDEVFAEKFQDAFLVALFVVQVNYKDFFQGANQSGLGAKLQSLTQR